MFHKIKAALVSVLCVVSGCVAIPDDDIAFLDRKIPIGTKTTQARIAVSRRGFDEVKVRAKPRHRFDHGSQKFVPLPLSNSDIVQQNIGFVALNGQPNGHLTCFARSYTRLVASGDRLICWTMNKDQKITWRQAGWRGAGL